MRKNKTPGKGGSSGNGSNGNSLSAQRQRTIGGLQETLNGLNTIELREQYDVMMPAARVHELRWEFGFNIQRFWDYCINAQGNKHRVARYVLFPGKWVGAI